jgi:serine/threonine protein kinase
MGVPSEKPFPWVIGRYVLHRAIASGGMASVHLGRLIGPGGFGRTVAIKRLHPQYAKDPEFVAMFLDEARLAARVQHPNVVPTIDIIAMEGELFLVMEHVQGEALSRLVRAAQRANQRIPLPIVSAILSGALNGLHAAHETKDERRKLLGIVHRDVSPQNILVGVDGVPRVLDFGVAKAAGRIQTTMEGQIKGKIAYMAPEQLRQNELDRTADLYAAAVVLWETLTLDRLFKGDSQAQVVAKVLAGTVPRVSEVIKDVPPALDAVVARGLDRDPAKRFATGREMASALEGAVRPATPTEVGVWLALLAEESLRVRAEQISEIESTESDTKSGVETQAKLFLAELASGPDLSIAEVETQAAPEPLPAPEEKSNVGVASTEKPPRFPPPKRGGSAAILVGLALVLTLGGGVVALTRSPHPAEAVADTVKTGAVTAVATPSAAGVAPSTPVASAADTPSASPSASAPVASVKPFAVAPPPGNAKHAGAAGTRSSPAAAAGAPAAAAASVASSAAGGVKVSPECDPPYVIDANGEKHYKRQCF